MAPEGNHAPSLAVHIVSHWKLQAALPFLVITRYVTPGFSSFCFS